MPEPTRPSEEEWLGYFAALSNWGRWGEDDTRGTLNLITAEQVRRAASLVREGITVSCAREVDFTGSRKEDPGRALHFMNHTGTSAPAHGGGGANDWVILPLHGLVITHLDAHAHMFWDGRMYNGQDARLVTAEQGARRGNLAPAASGIVGRGVLSTSPPCTACPGWPKATRSPPPNSTTRPAARASSPSPATS